MFDQTLIRICLILGSFITAGYILRRVRQAKVQIEDTIFWLLFSAALLILAIFPGIAYWAACRSTAPQAPSPAPAQTSSSVPRSRAVIAPPTGPLCRDGCGL